MKISALTEQPAYDSSTYNNKNKNFQNPQKKNGISFETYLIKSENVLKCGYITGDETIVSTFRKVA